MANKLSTGAIVVILVALALFTGVVKIPTGTTGTVGVTTPNNPTGTLNCPSITQNFLVTVAYPDYTKSPIQLTLISGQTINAYSQTPSASTTVTAVQYSSSGSANALSGLNCGGSYLLTAGDNSNYFLNSTVANIGTSINLPVTIVAPKYSAPTITVANSTTLTPQSWWVTFHSTTVSQTKVGYLVIQAGQYTASEGPMAVSFAYNSQAIQSINFAGLSQSPAAVPAMSFLSSNAYFGAGATYGDANVVFNKGSQNAQVTFLLPSTNNYQYASPSGPSVGSYEIPIQIVTSSSYAANEPISVQITPGTNFFNTATGQVAVDVFKNPQTNANLFTPTTAAGAFVLQTT